MAEDEEVVNMYNNTIYIHIFKLPVATLYLYIYILKFYY